MKHENFNIVLHTFPCSFSVVLFPSGWDSQYILCDTYSEQQNRSNN